MKRKRALKNDNPKNWIIKKTNLPKKLPQKITVKFTLDIWIQIRINKDPKEANIAHIGN